MNVISDIAAQGQGTFNIIVSKLTLDNIIKYIIQGLAVAIAVAVIPNRYSSFYEIFVISVVSALTFFVLDIFTIDVASGARLGVGLGIGFALVNLNPSVVNWLHFK